MAKVCELCANYRPATGQCLDYGVVGDIQDCAQFVAADGSQIPENFKPAFAIRITTEESEAPRKEGDEMMVADQHTDVLDQIRVALLELRAEVEQLREAVKAQQAGNGDKQLVDRLLTILEAQVGVRGGAA